jgi:hypothetical protein
MKNFQNATQDQEKAQDSRETMVWESPTISEISRFNILGGPDPTKSEGVTADGSV